MIPSKKLRVGILFGGRSGEHEISVRSGASILNAIDREKYEVVALGIAQDGRWLNPDESQRLLPKAQPTFSLNGSLNLEGSAEMIGRTRSLAESLDVVFPVLHGTYGEDGTIQGLLELTDVAYVGSGVLGSAAGMDKDIMKKLFAAAGLEQTPYLAVLRGEWRRHPQHCQQVIEETLAYPLFIKPANLGSSVGISKVHGRSELAAAMDLAASFDRKIVVEQGVGGPGVKPRELEVAVLGNDEPEVSVVGEIIPNKEFYDYESKYIDSPDDPSVPIIPARITEAESTRIQAMALKAFRACDCSGLARVDFLMAPISTCGAETRIYLNEINTMPGFTSISMYPKLWESSGLSYKALIDRLITLAVERRSERAETVFHRTS